MGMDRIADRAIIDGKRFAAGLLDDITARVKKLEEETGQVPGLAVVLVGEDPASRVYSGRSIARPLPPASLHSNTSFRQKPRRKN